MLEYGSTPYLAPEKLKEIGYTVAAYPLTLLSASTKAMQIALHRLKVYLYIFLIHRSNKLVSFQFNIKEGRMADILSFSELQSAVGFPEYYNELDKYI
jgi:hypothetical protein